MTKKPKRGKKRPETYEKKLTLHPLTIEEALKIAMETKPPEKKIKGKR
ncbi:MAG TPA: hypothetical protein VJV04_04775 [Nitrospiraceae bacterium]|nr:hypothetical protein [Nitrospiraceae bacterium]